MRLVNKCDRIVGLSIAMTSAIWSVNAQTGQTEAQLSTTGMRLLSVVSVQPGLEADATARPSILDQKTSEYVFGRLVSRKTLALQVTIKNTSPTYDLLVSQISLGFCLPPAKPTRQQKTTALPQSPLPCAQRSQVSLASMDKVVLQGLADRGQSTDPRNVWLRIIEGVGTAAVPFPTFIHHIGASYTPAVAAWNGPFTQAYKQIFPDYTVNQVVRLSNLAFTTNKVVGKGTSETVVAFIPIDVLMSKDERNTFKSDPQALFADLATRAEVDIEAAFISPVKTTPPKITSVAFDLTARTMQIAGTGFDETTKIVLNGSEVPTAFVSNTSLGGFLPAAVSIANGQSESVQLKQADGTMTSACKVTVAAGALNCASS